MAHWIYCTPVSGEGKRILLNLDAAYMISPNEKGSEISFLVAENGSDHGETVSHIVCETPSDILKKPDMRQNA